MNSLQRGKSRTKSASRREDDDGVDKANEGMGMASQPLHIPSDKDKSNKIGEAICICGKSQCADNITRRSHAVVGTTELTPRLSHDSIPTEG